MAISKGKKFDTQVHGLKNRKNKQDEAAKDIQRSVKVAMANKKTGKDKVIAKKDAVVDVPKKNNMGKGNQQKDKKKVKGGKKSAKKEEVVEEKEQEEVNEVEETEEVEDKEESEAEEAPLAMEEEGENSDGDFEEEEEEENKNSEKLELVALDKAAQKSFEDKLSSLKAKAKTAADEEMSSVVYMGHIPFGFFEEQVRGFFEQFGVVKNVKISRSKKSGRSKGYGFVQFEDVEVAQIAAETMDNYLIFGRLLKCKCMKKSEVENKNIFRGCDHKFRTIPWRMVDKARHNKPKTVEGVRKIKNRLVKKQAKKAAMMKELGMKYTFDGYKACEI
eukprot:Nk52_evm24s293 gene=Nk52_evmTU24s293